MKPTVTWNTLSVYKPISEKSYWAYSEEDGVFISEWSSVYKSFVYITEPDGDEIVETIMEYEITHWAEIEYPEPPKK